jgi:hypothetical protein
VSFVCLSNLSYFLSTNRYNNKPVFEDELGDKDDKEDGENAFLCGIFMASSCVRASSLLLRDRSEVSSSLVAAVCWPDNNNKDNPRGVLLQAKTREQAQSRMESLRTECLDVAQTRRQTAGYKAKIKELEIRLEYYKLMGKDRSIALDDAEMRR